MERHGTKLGTKLTALIVWSLILVSLVTGVLIIQNQRETLDRAMDHDGESLARTIAELSVDPMLASDPGVIQSHITTAAEGNTDVVFVRVHDSKGKLVAAHPPGSVERPADPAARLHQSPILLAVDDRPRELLGSVEVGLCGRRFSLMAQGSISRLGLGTLFGFGLLALVLWLFLRRHIVGPLAELDRCVKRITEGDLSQSVKLDRPDELGRLAAGLEAMRLSLKQSYERIQEQVEAKTNALLAAEQASKVKTQFLANMSHEFRTPLNAIIGMTQLLIHSDCTPEQQADFETIEERAQALLAITGDMLNLASIESRSVEVACVPCSPGDLLRTLEKPWSAEAAAKGLSFLVELQPGLPRTVWTDAAKLETILKHLVGNALKFTQRGGVRVTAWVKGEAGPEGRSGPELSLHIDVADTGIGIEANLLHAIFEPFSQADSSNSRRYGGTGVGLSISRQFARAMGGDIEVQSQPGKGSTFTATVRARAGPPAGSVEVRELASAAG